MPDCDLWHADAFVWHAGSKRAKQPPTVQSFVRPIGAEEVDSESDDDNMEDGEEWPEDAAVEGHKTSEDQAERSCRGGEGDVVAEEPGVEPGPMVAAGARSERKEDIDDGTRNIPTGSREQPATTEEQVQSRGLDAPGDGGQAASGEEHNAKPTDTGGIKREGHEHAMKLEGASQRGDGTLDGGGTMPPEGAGDGAQEDAEDYDNG